MFLAGSFPGGLTAFKFSELARSTNNFSSNNIIGSGGFGNVYRVSYLLLFCSYNYEKRLFYYIHVEDVQSCTNYRRIKLMSHTMKLWERVIEHRMRAITRVSMN